MSGIKINHEIKFNLISFGLLITLGVPVFLLSDGDAAIWSYVVAIYGFALVLALGIVKGSRRRN